MRFFDLFWVFQLIFSGTTFVFARISNNPFISYAHSSHRLPSDQDQLNQTDSEFEPYADNGGSTIGIAGKDFVVIAADARLSDSYMIRSRNISRISQVNLSHFGLHKPSPVI